MKLSSAWILALLAFATVSEARFLQDENEEEADTAADAGADAEADAGEAGEAGEEALPEDVVCEEGDEECEAAKAEAAEKAAAAAEEEAKDDPAKKFLPGGTPSRPHQNVFTQGAYNWDGAAIYAAFTNKQISSEDIEEDEAGNKIAVYDETLQPNVGRIDGQTGWIGVNQAGEKTMSYQIAIIIKANEKLSDMIAVNRKKGETTQIGWWIPSRGEGVPPEKWTMNLASIQLQTDVKKSEIEMRQTIWQRGLYDLPGASFGGYVDEYDQFDEDLVKTETQNVATWTFDHGTGQLDTFADNEDTIKSKDPYFVPIQSKTVITEDMLVIAIEGTSLKENLPELRAGSTVPFYFQIIDYNLENAGYMLRQKFDLELKWSEDYNGCNEPAECKEDVVEEGSSMLATFAASSIALASLLAF